LLGWPIEVIDDVTSAVGRTVTVVAAALRLNVLSQQLETLVAEISQQNEAPGQEDIAS
jgi:hypothetical protein